MVSAICYWVSLQLHCIDATVADVSPSTQPDPADLGAICGADSSDVVSIIKSTCTDGDSQAALSAYSSTCSAAGQLSSM